MTPANSANKSLAKPIAPRVPLLVLSLAGVLGDVIFFILQFLGIECFNPDQFIAQRGRCSPYTNDYTVSHSLVGTIVSGTLVIF